MPKLRDFQEKAKQNILCAWLAGAKAVILVLPTGGGKTVIFSDIIANHPGKSVTIAHRQEIVSQISLTMARNGVRHKIIGPDNVVKVCRAIHLQELDRSYIDQVSRVAVAGVDTLIKKEFDPQVSLVVQDEAHHVLKDNKWGKALSLFPNARCLGVTATPCRADGKGLSRSSHGVFDYMVQGPTMRELINDGWLTDYRIFAPHSDIDLSAVPISASGDFSPPKLAAAVHKSHIIGDVVSHYCRIAPGRLGITFAVDVASATDIADAYRQKGVSAEVVTAKTPDLIRQSILQRFRRREILQLVNVDLFGEGFDLPAIEVVSMARPTQSLVLFHQQFGRALRPMEGKDHAIIIDHVSNIHRHGLPDAYRSWSIDPVDRSKRSAKQIIPIRTCPGCSAAYERIHRMCPYCGYAPEPMGRSTPEEVDGDLSELSPDALERLRNRIDATPVFPYSAEPAVINRLKRIHREKQEAQMALREAMAIWGGVRTNLGDDIPTAQRRFYHLFGVDVATAQTLNASNARELLEKLK